MSDVAVATVLMFHTASMDTNSQRGTGAELCVNGSYYSTMLQKEE